MKKISILILSVTAFLLKSFAYERPFLQEGKRWNIMLHNLHVLDDEVVPYTYEVTHDSLTYLLEGDTVISQRTCKKLYEIYKGKKTYHGAMYEDSRKKVFYYEAGNSQARTLYYGRPLASFREYDVQSEGRFTYSYTDTILVEGGQFLRYHFSFFDEDDNMPECTWIDGVGGMGGPFYFSGMQMTPTCICDWTTYEFLSCEVPGEWTVTASDFSKPAITDGVDTAPRLNNQAESGSSIIYDLVGRRVDGKKPGVYIRNGKKVVIK